MDGGTETWTVGEGWRHRMMMYCKDTESRDEGLERWNDGELKGGKMEG